MSAFDHLFLTRYSAVFVEDQDPPDEDWLRYRLGFFMEACMASMERQTNSDFRWLVFVDDRCSDGFRADFDALSEGLFEPIWSHQVFWSGLFRDEVAKRCSGSHVITTRLDNDDAVARDFVASVQHEFDDQDRLFVNFPRGLQVDRSGAVHRYDAPSNSFLSLIEKRTAHEPPLTIFGSPIHVQVRRDGPLREVQGPPMWLQVVHGGNIVNSVRGPRIAPSIVDERFDIDLDYRQDVSGSRLLYEKVTRGVVIWARRLTDRLLLTEWAIARVDRVRGTRTKAQLPAE